MKIDIICSDGSVTVDTEKREVGFKCNKEQWDRRTTLRLRTKQEAAIHELENTAYILLAAAGNIRSSHYDVSKKDAIFDEVSNAVGWMHCFSDTAAQEWTVQAVSE